MQDWSYYEVSIVLRWMLGGECCDGTIIQRLHAASSGHAVARATDRLREWYRGDIDEAISQTLEARVVESAP